MEEQVAQMISDNELGDLKVEWDNPPTLMDLKYDLEQSRSYHNEHKTKVEEWLDNLNIEGKAKITPRKGRSSVAPKLIRKQAEWRYPALSEPFLNTDEVFDAQASTWEDVKSAKQNKLLLNHQFNDKIDKNAFIDEFVRTAVDEGTAIIRLGWKYEEEEYESEEPVVNLTIDPNSAQLLEEIGNLKQANPNEYETTVPPELKIALEESIKEGVPYSPTVTGYETVTKTRIIENTPTIEIADYNNTIIDPTCNGDVDKANFVIFSFEASHAELVKDGRYSNLDKLKIENNGSGGSNQPDEYYENKNNHASNFEFKDEARKKHIVHEYWGFSDINKNGVLEPILVSWVGNTIIQMTENPFPDKKLPIVVVQYLPVRKSIYGEPDGSLLEDNQKIIGAVTRGMIDIMGRSANGQTGMSKQFVDATNKRKFEKGLDYMFNAGADPRSNIHMHTFPEIPNSAQFMLQLQNAEAESVTGVKAFSGGLSGDSFGDVAAGVRGILDSAAQRELGILRRLARGMVKVGKKITSMNAEFLSETEVVRVTNEQFVEVRKEELAGRFDLKLTISTAEEDNAKAEQFAFLLQTMGNNLDPAIMQILMAKLVDLRRLPDIAKQIREYQPQPDPVQQEIQQLEIQKLNAEIAKLQSETQENYANAQLDTNKANTESAKAGLINQQTGKQALDHVEQESGVTQERDLQKQKAQAQGNIELEKAKADLANQGKQRDEDAKVGGDLLRNYLSSTRSTST